MDTHKINKARIVYYGFFAAFFSFYLEEKHLEIIEKCVEFLRKGTIDEQTAGALANIRRKLKKGGFDALKNESDRIFFSPSMTFVPMTASYYTEQRDGGNKRMEMISYIAASKFRRNADVYKEQEDHIEFIFLFIQRLIEEELNGDAGSSVVMKKIFANILNETIEPFCDSLLAHEESFIYRDVALALSSFAAFERFFLGIDAPRHQEKEDVAEGTINRKKRIPQEFYKKKSDRECV